jgi:hypothetical protein
MEWKWQNEMEKSKRSWGPGKSKVVSPSKGRAEGRGQCKTPKYLTIFLKKCDISLIYIRVRAYCHVLAQKFVGKFTKLHVNR